jgi:hypothetical protein
VVNSSANRQPFPSKRQAPTLVPGPGARNNEFNTIRVTVTALKGKTFLTWRPLDFAKALSEIAAAVAKAR